MRAEGKSLGEFLKQIVSGEMSERHGPRSGLDPTLPPWNSNCVSKFEFVTNIKTAEALALRFRIQCNFLPTADMSRVEISQCSSPLPRCVCYCLERGQEGTAPGPIQDDSGLAQGLASRVAPG